MLILIIRPPVRPQIERDVFSVYSGLKPAPGLKDQSVLFYGHYSISG